MVLQDERNSGLSLLFGSLQSQLYVFVELITGFVLAKGLYI